MTVPREPVKPGSVTWASLNAAAAAAVEALGNACLEDPGPGFLDTPKKAAVHGADALDAGEREAHLYAGLLTFLFRILVCGLAEQRGLLWRGWPGATLFREILDRSKAGAAESPTGGFRLWSALDRVFRFLAAGERPFCPGRGYLFGKESNARLKGFRCRDRGLLDALSLLFEPLGAGDDGVVDLAGLPPETPGRIYEGLLPYSPCIRPDAGQGRATFVLLPSRILRRRSGAYYTSPDLVEALLDSALKPVIRDALKRAEASVRRDHQMIGARPDPGGVKGQRKSAAAAAILSLKVVDPACGGAAFLVGALDLLARELARVRGSDFEKDGRARRRALKDVLLHCLHGVDRDPMAVELAGVILWLKAEAGDLPAGALEDRLKWGDALVGAPWLEGRDRPDGRDGHDGREGFSWPRAVPCGAFTPVEGDSTTVASAVRERNRSEASAIPADAPLPSSRDAQDLWTAAFFWPLSSGADGKSAPTTRSYHAALDGGRRRAGRGLSGTLMRRVRELSARERFFHWPLEFPEVFSRPGRRGFDCVLGNPPWERIKLQEREFFERRAPTVARAGSADQRERLIARLAGADPALHRGFLACRRRSAMQSRFFRHSGRYGLACRGDPNLYLFFVVLFRDLLAPRGRAGMVVPSGIATDYGASPLFRDLMERRSLVSLFDFINTGRIFPGIAPPNRFCLLTLSGARIRTRKTSFQFYATSLEELRNRRLRFTLDRNDLRLLNPLTGTCPPFTSRRQADLTRGIYRRFPVLCGDNRDGPWSVKLWNMFHMSADSGWFKTRQDLEAEGFRPDGEGNFEGKGARFLRLYEAKLMHNLNHRYNTFEGVTPERRAGVKPRALPFRGGTGSFIEPRYWVPEDKVEGAVRRAGWPRRWFLAVRSVTNVITNRRSAVAAVLPWCGIGNSATVILSSRPAREVALLTACLSSFAFDFAARSKLGGPNLNFFILKQLPVPPPSAFDRPFRGKPLSAFVFDRALELMYTAPDLSAFALDCGYRGPPFPWDEERRLRLRSELDALFFLLYDISLSDVDRILGTFPILERKEQARFGAYRTRRLILDALGRYGPFF